MKKIILLFFLIAGCSYLSAQAILEIPVDTENPRAKLTHWLQQRLAARITPGSGLSFLALDSMIISEHAKRFYTYDEQGREIEAINHSIPTIDDNSPPLPLGPSQRQISSYNPNELELIIYDWSDTQMDWKLRSRLVYTLNSNGDVTQHTYYAWINDLGNWRGVYRQTFLDTPEGYDHTEENWHSSTNNWRPIEMNSYSINPENQITQKTTYLPDANGWIPINHHIYAYDADGRKIEEIVSIRDDDTGMLINYEKYTIAYNVSGQASDYARYLWYAVFGAWKGYFRITHAYYPDSTLALAKRYDFDEFLDEWTLENTNEFFYTYAPDGRLSEKIEWRWHVPTQALAPRYRETFAYDSDGNLIDYVYFWRNTSNTEWMSVTRRISTFDLTIDVADLIFPNDEFYHEFNYYSELFRNAKLVSLETLAFNYGANELQPDKTATYYFSELLTATGEAAASETLKLFPNPVSNLLTLSTNAPRASSYQIIDLNGRILQQEKSWNGDGIDVSRLIPGNYFIRLMEGNRIITGKFIKS